jgi:hypothetical protein
MAHVIVLSLIFSYARDRALFGIDFPVFIVTGIVPFLMFKNIALRVMDGVEANRALFAYRQIKPMDTFIARTLLDAFSASRGGLLGMAGRARRPFGTPSDLDVAILVLMDWDWGGRASSATLPNQDTDPPHFSAALPAVGHHFPIAVVPHEYLPCCCGIRCCMPLN